MAIVEISSGIRKVEHPLGKFFYVKTRSDGYLEGSLLNQYVSYRELEVFLRMPKAKMILHNNDYWLIVDGIPGQSLDKLISSNPDLTGRVLKEFCGDIVAMWYKTKNKINSRLMVRDMNQETIDTINQILQDPELSKVSNHHVVVNGNKYPSFGETTDTIVRKLALQNKPNVAVMAHGDENLPNIVEANKQYWAIDPRSSGLLPASQAVNSLLGHTHLVIYDYDSNIHAEDSSLVINFQMKPDSKLWDDHLQKAFKWFKGQLDYFDNDSLWKEYLFANLSRALIGKVKPVNRERVWSNRYSLLGLAYEMYYN